jgi:hypothetical protein
MKNPISSFIFLLSSFALLNTESAQWVIDGQQVQTLNLNVSDPQALYADGSRELTGTIPLAPSLTTTGGIFRAYIPWSGLTADLLQMDGDDECLKLSSDPNVQFQVGGVQIGQSGINGYGVSVGFEDNTLFGPWKLYEVTDNSKALLNRSYADARYVMNGQDSVALGLDTVAAGEYSIAAGYKSLASGKYSVAFNGAVDPEEGVYTNVASGMGSAVFGWGNIASGNGAVAFGWESVAGGDWSFAAGSSDAIGEFSTALGEICNASGSDSFAVGYNTSASGTRAVALGHSTSASAQGAFANGFLSSATENYSTAWGRYCEASGLNSIALGNRAKALHPGAVVIADNQDADATSATNNTFTVRAQNGVYLQTDTIHSSGSLAFDSSVGTSTSGLFKVVTSWNGPADMFLFDSDEEAFVLSSIGAGLRIGSLQISSGGLFHASEGTAVDFGEHILTGGWQVDEVLPYSEAIISRGYADDRYLMRTEGITTNHTVQAGDVLVISNGLITAINP